MIDRKQVIYDIERCTCREPYACKDCSRYKIVDGLRCVEELMTDASTLLKEQEARNVIAEKRRVLFDDSGDEAKYGEDIFYHCPSCNRILSRTHMNKDIHFCEKCGQKVTWA